MPFLSKKNKSTTSLRSAKYGDFLNGHTVKGDAKTALEDIRKSGLDPKTLKMAGVRLFNDSQAKLMSLLRFTEYNQRRLLDSVLVQFPYFDSEGNILYSRFKLVPSITDKEGKETKYLQPKGIPATPYILPKVWGVAEKTNKPLWITEGEKKGLILTQYGECAVALPGVWNFKLKNESGDGSDDDLSNQLKMFKWESRLVYIAFDMDLWVNPQVKNALWELVFHLLAKGSNIRFPMWDPVEGKGIDDYLFKKKKDGIDPKQSIQELKQRGKEVYDLISTEHRDALLRAFSKVSLPPIVSEPLLKDISRKLKIKEATLVDEIKKRRERREKKGSVLITKKERKEAVMLLQNPDLLELFLERCHTEYVGRDNELTILKLATFSRHFAKGLPVIVTGTASVGKSHLINAVMRTVWEDDYEEFTKWSPNYLIYRDSPLTHRILVIFELHGTEESEYIVRTALSEGKVSHGSVKTDGSLEHVEISKSTEGLVIFSTLAEGVIEGQLATRVITFELSHDPKLARKIYRVKAKQVRGLNSGSNGHEPTKTLGNQGNMRVGSSGHRDSDEGAIPLNIWRAADKLVEPKEVVIPYAKKLADSFPTERERYARDLDKVFLLIRCSALFHQYQRKLDKNGRIMANRDDYEVVYSLRGLITQSVSSIPVPIRVFLEKIEEMTKAGRPTLRFQVQKELKVSDSTIKRYVSTATRLNVLITIEKGREQVLQVVYIPDAQASVLPRPEKVFKRTRRHRLRRVSQ